MDKQSVKCIIDELVIEYANEQVEELSGKNLVEDLGYDSISLIELITALEDKLGVTFESDMMFENFDNYDSLIEYIMELINDGSC